MSDQSLYEADILAWAEQQAELLRQLAARRDLPNDLDLPNITEEIEGVARNEFNAVKSLLKQILIYLIKAWANPEPGAVRHWMIEIDAWHEQLLENITPSMRQRIDMDDLWRKAIRRAGNLFLDDGQDECCVRVRRALEGKPCPLTLDQLCAPRPDFIDIASSLSDVDEGLRSVDLSQVWKS